MMASFDLYFLASVATRSAVVLFLGWFAIRLLRNASPRLRYDAAVMTMIAALMVPVAYSVLPSLHVLPTGDTFGGQVFGLFTEKASTEAGSMSPEDMQEWSNATASTQADDSNSLESTAGVSDSSKPTSTNAILEAVTYVVGWVRSLSIGQLVFLTWMTGVGLILLRFVTARFTLGRLWSTASPVTERAWQDAIEEAGDRVFLTRAMDVRELAGIRSPMTWGVIAPRLLLPVEAREWTHERKLNALMHEMVHVRRMDAALDLLSAFVVALNWFNPLAWLMRAELKAQREASCDTEVLMLGAQPEEYARMLIDVAKNMRQHRSAPRLAMTIARPSQLEGRVLSVLNYEPGPTGKNFRWMIAGCMTFVVLLTAAAAPISSVGESTAGIDPIPMPEKRELDTNTVQNVPGQNRSQFDVVPEDIVGESASSSENNEEMVWPGASQNDDALSSEEAIGDLFAVAGIKLADAVLNELGQSVERLDWGQIMEEVEWDIEGEGWELDNLDLEFDKTGSSDVDAAMSRLTAKIQGAVIDELEKAVRDEPDSDKARRARKALLEIDSEASRSALKRLGVRKLDS